MRNNVPDGDFSALVQPAGVEERAGGLTGRVLIEQLRASIRMLEQVPVSLAIPPAPGAAPSRPACSLTPPSTASGTANSSPEGPLSVLRQGACTNQTAIATRLRGLALRSRRRRDQRKIGSGAVVHDATSGARMGTRYGPGLVKAGLDPARFLIVETRTADEAAWALEEGLKSAALSACLAQAEIKTPLAARRLGLAARAAGIPCFLLTGHGETNIPGTLTRWRIATEGSAHVPFDTRAPGTACWRLSLERSRAGTLTPSSRPEAGRANNKPSSSAERGRANRKPATRGRSLPCAGRS